MTGKKPTGEQMPLWVAYVRVQGQLLKPVALTKSLLGGLYRAYWRDGSCSAVYPQEVVWKHENVDPNGHQT